MAFEVFCWATTNILMEMIMSKTWPHPYDPEFVKLRDAYVKFFTLVTPGNLTDFFPIMRPFMVNGTKKTRDSHNEVLMPWFKKRTDSFHKHRDNPRDYLDFILLKREEILNKRGEDKVPQYLSMEAIYSNQVDNLGIGGFDTTASATDWSLVFFG
eukprot:TRINITY_DN82_c0_g1_i2.p1 TRINITY_DN82_c0_g1~~TRINITY_DN82_c0_g1_i2.p1  ORF type:complete len:155 (+),score=23.05 TRINITY_DN82_c0_g1_i2:635-1099(+)